MHPRGTVPAKISHLRTPRARNSPALSQKKTGGKSSSMDYIALCRGTRGTYVLDACSGSPPNLSSIWANLSYALLRFPPAVPKAKTTPQHHTRVPLPVAKPNFGAQISTERPNGAELFPAAACSCYAMCTSPPSPL